MTSGARRGFTLLELSIVLTIVALVTGMAISSGIGVIAGARLTATQTKMKTIDDALMAYRAANDRLPCPADLTLSTTNTNYGLEAGSASTSTIGVGTGVCTGTGMVPAANFTGAGATNTTNIAAEGALPALTLGLPQDMMVDGWGNRFRYAVDVNYTANGYFTSLGVACNIAAITINDSNGNARSTSSVYALISHGPNGHGAYSKSGVTVNAGSVNTNELLNCHCDSTGATTTSSGVQTTNPATYVQMQPTIDANTSDANYQQNSFDDIVTYKERWQLQTPWDTPKCPGVYVTDYINSRIQIFNLNGVYVNQFGSNGTANGKLSGPRGVVVDNTGAYVWVADYFNNRVEKFGLSGNYLMAVGAGYNGVSGAIDSSGSANGQLSRPMGLAIDANNNLWVVDSNNNRVVEYNGTTGAFITGLGAGYNGVAGTVGSSGLASGQFNAPTYLAFDANGNIWVADHLNNRVQELTTNGSFINALGAGYNGVSGAIGNPGTNQNGQLNGPSGLAFDIGGNVYVASYGSSNIQEFTSSGTFVNKFGTSAPGALSNPNGVTMDSNGLLWIANYGNNTVVELSTAGTYKNQFGSAGTGNGQFNGLFGLSFSSR